MIAIVCVAGVQEVELSQQKGHLSLELNLHLIGVRASGFHHFVVDLRIQIQNAVQAKIYCHRLA
jgi:hypothetical protein